MKKKVISKIVPMMLVVATAFTLMGCNVTKTVTYTETHTDANGNTESTTTTTVEDSNGKTTTTETTNSAESEVEPVEDVAEDINSEPEYIVATISFDNEAGFDIAEMYFSPGTSDNWGDEILGEYAPLNDGVEITFHDALTYSENSLQWELLVADSEGSTVEFSGLDMSYAEDPENIIILLEYDEDEQSYKATVE